MFFFLSKTLGVMLLPTNFLIGIGIAGLVLRFTRFAPLGRKLVFASIALLAFCGFSPLGNWLLYPLEQRFPPWDASSGAPDGIVVLGAAIDPDLSAARGAPEGNVRRSAMPPWLSRPARTGPGRRRSPARSPR